MTVLGEVQKHKVPPQLESTTPFDAASPLRLGPCNTEKTHQSGLLTLARAVLDLGRCGIGRFALAVAVHDFGVSVVA